MDSKQPPSKSFDWVKTALILVAVVVVAVVAWYAYHKKHNDSPVNNSVSSLSQDWTQYKATKYGFMFDYPKTWGTPTVSEYTRKQGTHYEIGFSTDTKQGISVTAAFDSKDEMNPGCGGSCGILKGYVKEDVLKALSGTKANYVKYDSSSYSTLQVDPKSDVAGELFMYQIVNLSKIKATAAQIAYTRMGSATCPSDKLADNNVSGCVTLASYNDLNRFAKSIKNL